MSCDTASWILDLLTLPTKFIVKRLRELRSLFQHSFHTAPCLKFSTKGPLTLKDIQQLAVSHSELSLFGTISSSFTHPTYLHVAALGDECTPVPMQPLVVGHDHEWLQISPLAIPAWVSPPRHTPRHCVLTAPMPPQDKLMLEPYALKKTALYLILTPSFSPSPSLSCSSTTALLLKYFQELSIVYRVPI